MDRLNRMLQQAQMGGGMGGGPAQVSLPTPSPPLVVRANTCRLTGYTTGR